MSVDDYKLIKILHNTRWQHVAAILPRHVLNVSLLIPEQLLVTAH